MKNYKVNNRNIKTIKEEDEDTNLTNNNFSKTSKHNFNKKKIITLILFCFILVLLLILHFKLENEKIIINEFKNIINKSFITNNKYNDTNNKILKITNELDKIINESLAMNHNLQNTINKVMNNNMHNEFMNNNINNETLNNIINNVILKNNINNETTKNDINNETLNNETINSNNETNINNSLIFNESNDKLIQIEKDLIRKPINKNIPADITNIIWKIGRKYIDKCLQNILINEIPKLPEDNNPLISVIIPVYNSNKTITTAIRSIQNQNIMNFEIILINDFSSDNSLEVIENLQKNDSRIKIINNNKNMGTLYSRCIGVLSAKGKYIFSLDNDDMFFVDDVFQMISSIAEADNFDIVEYHSVFATKYDATPYEMKNGGFYTQKHNLVLYQPQLALFPIQRFNRFERNDFEIWSKCIKTEIYKKAINLMGEKRYSTYMTWAEDTSMIFVIFSIAQSFKYVVKYGIFHIETGFCASFNMKDYQKTFGEIFLIDIVFDFTRNNSDKNYAAYQAIDSTKRDFFNVTYNEEYKNYITSVLKKIYQSEYITDDNKQKVRERYSKFNLSIS